MIVYRITTPRFTNLTASGRVARWNVKGQFVIYTASSIALACLENIVHRDSEGLMGDFRVLSIEIPKRVFVKRIELNDLSKEWSEEGNFKICQKIATNWLENSESCILCVPSAIIPQENNFLINPQHPNFKYIKILSVQEFTFDNRIKNS
jgi:RES domain-containing protein